MKGEKFQFFADAVPDLILSGTAYQGTCPSCQRHTLSIKIVGLDEFEPFCPHCSPANVRDAVRAEIHRRATAGRNGARPTPGSTPNGQDPSVASVAYFPPSRAAKDALLELPEEALYGLPGDVVRTIRPHTESHPAAVLGSFLAGAGCLAGAGPHVYRDGAKHACNEFIALVGRSAKGRKGTGTRRAHELFKFALGDRSISQYDILPLHPPEHARAREGSVWGDILLGGLGSGEALIESLALANEAGEAVPRRLLVEEEFSKPLKVMRREGSILSETLRHAWDGAVLSNRTKGKALVAEASHVAVLVHTTEMELQENLSPTEAQNGFANRFLWLLTGRVQSLPFGGGDVALAPLVQRLHTVLEFAAGLGRMEFDADASRIWAQGGVYDLLVERPAGLLGAVTSRAESHVTRLALLYAVMDLQTEIRVPHLLAALGLWEYNERSAAVIFGESTGDDYADLILEYLWEVQPGFLTRVEIRDRFRRHAEPGRIPKALALLESLGAVTSQKIEGEGRHPEAWTAVHRKICDRSDGSPLERAKALAI